jgi:hypothetical protein
VRVLINELSFLIYGSIVLMVKNKATSKKSTKISSLRSNSNRKTNSAESDSHFFLKTVLFLILGTQWVFIQSTSDFQIPIPVGLIIGLVFASHEHFRIDRKIEYVILLFSAFISFWLPFGIVIQI